MKVFPIDTPTQKYLEQPMVINAQGTRTAKHGYSPSGEEKTTNHFTFSNQGV